MGFFFNLLVCLKRCSRIIFPVQQDLFWLNNAMNNGRAINIQCSREGTSPCRGMMFGSVDKRKLSMPVDVELTVGNDYVSFFDGCNENFNHCSLRPDLSMT